MAFTKFPPRLFTPTSTVSAEEKAYVCNQLITFVQVDFLPVCFTPEVYRALSNMYGHIAHYNHDGFYQQWFSTRERRQSWLEYASHYGWHNEPIGDPSYTWVDVEKIVTHWIVCNRMVERYREIPVCFIAVLKSKYNGYEFESVHLSTRLSQQELRKLLLSPGYVMRGDTEEFVSLEITQIDIDVFEALRGTALDVIAPAYEALDISAQSGRGEN